MGDLLKKEKKFHEINENLNKFVAPRGANNTNTTTTGGSPKKQKRGGAAAKQQQQQDHTRYSVRAPVHNAANTSYNEQAFHHDNQNHHNNNHNNNSNYHNATHNTYTKRNGISTFLKKQGAGDFHPSIMKKTTATAHTMTQSSFGRNKPRNSKDSDDLILRYKNYKFNEADSIEALVPEGQPIEESDYQTQEEPVQIQKSIQVNTYTAGPAYTHIHGNLNAPNHFGARGGGVNGTKSTKTQYYQEITNSEAQPEVTQVVIKPPVPTTREHKLASNDKKKFNTDSMIKFLKSKVAILEEEHGSLNRELAKQKEITEKALERNKLLETQRDQAVSKSNALAEQVQRLEAKVETANTRLKEKGQIQLQLQKEVEEVRQQLKILTLSHTNTQKRLHRAHEEIGVNKSSLESMKKAERELKDQMRLELESKELALKNHKKMRTELLNAIRKQLYLIDNLGRQNVCLEQGACLTLTESDFNKLLDIKVSKDKC